MAVSSIPRLLKSHPAVSTSNMASSGDITGMPDVEASISPSGGVGHWSGMKGGEDRGGGTGLPLGTHP